MIRFVALAALLGAALASFSRGDDEAALADRLIARLDSERAADREAAKCRLLLLGRDAVARALERAASASPRVRAEVVDLAARSGVPGAIERSLGTLDDPDEYVARTAAAYLLELAPEAVDPAIRTRLEEKVFRTPMGRELAAKIVRSHLFERVEIVIRSKIVPGAGNGFYEGQLAELGGLGEGASEVVLTMFLQGPSFRWMHPVVGEEADKLPFLVGEALIEVANVGMRGILREEYGRVERDQQREEVIEVALARAGDLSLVQSKINSLERQGRAADVSQSLYRLAELYYRLRLHEKSLEVYDRILRYSPGDSLALYNKACALCRLSRIDEAFRTLESAWDSGYRDFKWAEKDGDLANLRADPRWEEFARRIQDR